MSNLRQFKWFRVLAICGVLLSSICLFHLVNPDGASVYGRVLDNSDLTTINGDCFCLDTYKCSTGLKGDKY